MLRRLDQCEIDGIEPPLPPAEIEPFWSWLMEVGPIEPAGMSTAPVGWVTIDAWMRRTGVRLAPWQARLLRRLSCDYHAEIHAAEDWARPPPWAREPTPEDRAAAERTLRAAFGIV